jgi:hypothetical protein
MKNVDMLIKLFILLPLWYGLLWLVLDKIEATTTMWIMYWSMVPIVVLCAIVTAIAESIAERSEK